MLCDVLVRRRCWAHASVIHAASHFYHEKRVAWVSISMHACDPVPIVMGLRLVALRAAGAPLLFFWMSFKPNRIWFSFFSQLPLILKWDRGRGRWGLIIKNLCLPLSAMSVVTSALLLPAKKELTLFSCSLQYKIKLAFRQVLKATQFLIGLFCSDMVILFDQ